MIKKILTILLAVVPLLGFSIDYDVNDVYNSGDYTVEAIAISNAQELFQTNGLHNDRIIAKIKDELSRSSLTINNGTKTVSYTNQIHSDALYTVTYTANSSDTSMDFSFSLSLQFKKPYENTVWWSNIVTYNTTLQCQKTGDIYLLQNTAEAVAQVESNVNSTNYNNYINYLDYHFGYVINIYNNTKTILYASAYIIKSEYASSDDADNWDNLVVMADGLDFHNKRTIYQVMGHYDFNNLFQPNAIIYNGSVQKTPLSSGKDICFIDFADGAGDIRHNAKIYLKLLEFISTKTNAQFSAGGFSMGGVISRLALLYAEKQNLSVVNQISKYLSIDSPQNGANIMPDLQDVLKIHDLDEWTDMKEPAPVQMLYTHAEYQSGEHDKFYSFLENMGDFPSEMKRYSIACSPWATPYPNLVPGNKAANVTTIGLSPMDIVPKGYDTVPGSSIDLLQYSWILFSETEIYDVMTGLEIEPTDPYNMRFKPTFIPVDSVYAIKSNTPSSYKDSNNLDKLAGTHYTPFDKLYATANRDEHITFSAELIGLILNCLEDTDNSSKIQKEAVDAATRLLM